MRDSLGKALSELGVEKDIEDFSKRLGSVLFGSKDNSEFQKKVNPIMTRKLKDLLFFHANQNLLNMFFEMNDVKNPKVINTQVIGVHIYDTFIIYDLGVDIVEANAGMEVVDCSFGKAYKVDKLVNSQMELIVDPVNKVEFLIAKDAGLAIRNNDTEPLLKNPEAGMLPVGMVNGNWSVLPDEIELSTNYGKLPTGTVLTLDVDKGLYMSEKGGIPASLYHLIFCGRMSISPDPFSVFVQTPLDGLENFDDQLLDAASENEGFEAEPQSGFPKHKESDPDDNDDLQNFFNDLKDF